MRKIKCVKLKERPDAEVKNNIAEGETRVGFMNEEPTVGERFNMAVNNRNGKKLSFGSFFSTSPVVEIIAEAKGGIIFKTLNSIYQINYV